MPGKTSKTELIERLLAKAESTTPEEAEALIEAATKLMAKHGVTEAMLAAQGKRPEESISVDYVECRTRYARELMMMIYLTSRAQGTTRVMYTKYDNRHYRVSIYGYDSDRLALKTLADSLLIQAQTATDAWWKLHRDEYRFLGSFDQFKARRSFVSGFGQGVAAKMREAMRVATQESDTATGTTGTALVLRDRGKAVDEYIGATGKSRMRGTGGSASAANAGFAAGKNANINQTAIGGGRTAIAR